MITPSSAYTTANAKLQKAPVWLIEIENYHYGLSNRSLGTFTPPLGPPPAQFAPTEASSIVDIDTPSFGAIATTSPDSGFIERWQSVSLGGWNAPGALLFDQAIGLYAAPGSDAPGAPARSSINSVKLQFAYTNAPDPSGYQPQWEIKVSVDGGATFHLLGLLSNVAGTFTADFDITSMLGSIATFDFNNIQIKIIPNSTGFATLAPPGAVLTVSDVGLEFDYTITPVTATAEPWLVSIDPLKLTVSDLDGGSDLSNLVFNVQDRGQLITADMPGFVFEGKECRLLEGFDGMALADFLLRYRGVINTVDADNGNLEYKFTVASFNLKKLTAAIYTVGDDGFATADKHPRNLNGHPLDMLVSALEQAGVDPSDIDTAKINYYKNTVFNGLTYVFRLTKAPVAKDFIENELMKPLGMYLWENSAGLVSINSFYPAMSGDGTYTPPTPPVMTLTVDESTDAPLPVEADLIDQVIMRFDDDGTGSNKFLAENIATWSTAIAKYGLTDGHIIESQGMKSAFLGYFMAAIISRLIFLRYGLKNLTFDPLPAVWTASVLDPGDIIAVTMPYVADRAAGVLGITTKTFEVLDRNWIFMDGTVELKLLEIDISAFKQFLITSNGEADYTAASGTDQGKYMFLSNTSNKYSNGNPANTLG
jgi:hypothetical protein